MTGWGPCRDDRVFRKRGVGLSFYETRKKTMFAYNVLNSFQKAKERIKYCDRELERIGDGSARRVYAVRDKHVLKLAKNEKGNAQNFTEGLLSAGSPTDMFAKVYYSSYKYDWVVSQRCDKINAKIFKEHTGLGFHAFCRCAAYEGLTRAVEKLAPDQLEELKRLVGDGKNAFFNKFSTEVDAVALKQSGVTLEEPHLADLHRTSSWGLTREETPRLVLVDYGLVTE